MEASVADRAWNACRWEVDGSGEQRIGSSRIAAVARGGERAGLLRQVHWFCGMTFINIC